MGWDRTNCYGMGQINVSHGQPCIFLMHADNLRKKAQRTKSRQLSCSKASKYVFINQQTR